MSNQDDVLGVCPACGAEIHSYQLLIEYEQADGTQGRFAECVDCGEVVSPE